MSAAFGLVIVVSYFVIIAETYVNGFVIITKLFMSGLF